MQRQRTGERIVKFMLQEKNEVEQARLKRLQFGEWDEDSYGAREVELICEILDVLISATQALFKIEKV